MSRKSLLIASILCFSLAGSGTVGTVYAQPNLKADSNVSIAEKDAVPTPDDPIPEEDVSVIDTVKDFLGKAWYLITAAVLFLLVALVRGKAKLGSWVVKIPWFSDWLDNAGSKFKFWFILVATGLGCAFGALADVQNWVFEEIAKATLSGFAVGLTTALAAMGVAKGKEVHTKPKHPSRNS